MFVMPGFVPVCVCRVSRVAVAFLPCCILTLGSCSGLPTLPLPRFYVACFVVRQRGRCLGEREPNVMIR
jgi:hypothetical protein